MLACISATARKGCGDEQGATTPTKVGEPKRGMNSARESNALHPPAHAIEQRTGSAKYAEEEANGNLSY